MGQLESDDPPARLAALLPPLLAGALAVTLLVRSPGEAQARLPVLQGVEVGVPAGATGQLGTGATANDTATQRVIF